MRLTPCRIVIATEPLPDGKVCEAEVAWPLAIHPSSPTPFGSGWTVTHVPTGKAVMYGRDRNHALELLTQCLEIAGPDRWAHVSEYPDPAIQHFVTRMRGKATAGAHRNGGTP